MEYPYLPNEVRGEERKNEKKENHKKFDFKSYHKNTVKSLNEVEYFLNHFNHFTRYFKLYRIIKK